MTRWFAARGRGLAGKLSGLLRRLLLVAGLAATGALILITLDALLLDDDRDPPAGA